METIQNNGEGSTAPKGAVTTVKYLSPRVWVQAALLTVVAILLVANLMKDSGPTATVTATTVSESRDKAVELVNQAVSLISARQYEAALSPLREALKLSPEYGLAYYNQGVALQFLGKIEESIASYTSALSFNNEDANSYYNRGLALRDSGKLVEAEADLRIASTLKPEWAAAKFNLGQVMISLDKASEGEQLIAEAKKLNPQIGK